MTTVELAPGARTTVSPMDARPLTCSIGAELHGVDLADVSRDADLFAELRSLLLKHKVLFFRDQDMSRAEHVALAERFGSLEDHPVVGSDPDHPGLVQIYKDLDSPPEAFENSFHCDATWRVNPPMGCVLRCVEGPAVGGDTIWVNMALAYERLPERVKERIEGCARGTASRRRSARDCRWRGASSSRNASRTPSIRWSVPTRRRGEDPLRQQLHHAPDELPHRRQRPVWHRLRPGRR